MRRKKIKEEMNKRVEFAQISGDNLVLRIYCAISQVRIHVYGI